MNHTPAPVHAEEPTEAEEEIHVITEAVRIGGLVMMSICISLAVGFAAWVVYHRGAPTVKMMQPQFLLMLCFGTVLSSFTIYCMGANDQNSVNINATCLAWPWLGYTGSTITLSALFSKLMRVNEIFHAHGFQRKVVTARDVLLPFVTLFVINLTLLICMSVLDPLKWNRVPLNEDEPYSTIGFCAFETWVGELLNALLRLVVFVALIILCVQAYRARDIKSTFSEARGVALAIFCWLQSDLIVTPTDWVVDPTDVDTRYTLRVMQEFVNNMAMLLFVFGPLIAHHRHNVKHGDSTSMRNTRISGLDMETCTGTTAVFGTRTSAATSRPSGHRRESGFDGEHHEATFIGSQMPTDPHQYSQQHPNLPEMVLEVQTLRARVAELQSIIATASAEGGGTGKNEAQQTIKERESDQVS
ncbi:Gamma-aminobutyric acid (GABA) B receptor [Seminavis robusta]|uniref:Gamma-aminobutyric acid (GABA) B receptor n=1 Tax=Seminavis robusta TaxID=568900 RepID=A0A9N8D7Y5_9STRA|nr:Gamma-aminobutyric acid (GABA) B receptor [Seminavis robusta]|eukprot:Sro33_g021620.1 Gamma-aminobutyric acid (GABA) B receptor (415) ;mRNA; r:123109-124353